MKRLLAILLLGVASLATAALADGQATREEAVAMAVKAADFLKANGTEKAILEFNRTDGFWHDRDLYVTVTDAKGVMVANGANIGLVGKSLIDLKDVDGKAFTRESLIITDTGWVDFKWRNPLTKAVELKTKYYVRVGEYLVGVGAYAQ